MQQARLANAVECKAEVGLRAIAMRMGVQLSNEALHLTTIGGHGGNLSGIQRQSTDPH